MKSFVPYRFNKCHNGVILQYEGVDSSLPENNLEYDSVPPPGIVS